MAKKRILIVDDSLSVRQQVGLALTQSGYDVIEAEDGLEGAEKIEKDSSSLDMVISDINMPRMSGIEMMERVSGIVSKGLPIIVLTTEGQPALIKRAKAAGAKGWIVKPFKAAQLVATVEKLTT
ncbi:MAG: response regulator [Deltaproteobacteria bacterium]|nr:response regulator [Deltaproteobacteria bacterium]